MATTSLDLNLTQIAWVVKDINAAKMFFKETLGISNLSRTETSRAKDYKSTYYGKPSDGENLFAWGYSGDAFIEIIQPVSGSSIFSDFISENPGGGIQHLAFTTPVENLDTLISEFEDKGFPVVSFFDTSIAKIVFFDTRKEIGVMTEIMGMTSSGFEVFEKMKGK